MPSPHLQKADRTDCRQEAGAAPKRLPPSPRIRPALTAALAVVLALNVAPSSRDFLLGAQQSERAKGEPPERQDDEGDPKAESDGKPAGEGDSPASAPGLLGGLGELVATGRTNKGLVHPIFRKGRLSTVLAAETMVRRDQEHLDIEGMQIEIYDEAEGTKSFVIDLQTAVLHLVSEELTSEEETTIEGTGFKITGERMVFDTAMGVGRLLGKVRMTVFDASQLTPGPSEVPEPEENDENESDDGTEASE